jgi:hypothetical protein
MRLDKVGLDSGGGGNGSLLTSSDPGGGAKATGGGTGSSVSTDITIQTPGDISAGADSKTHDPKNWRLGLPAELQEDVTLRKFSDIPALASAYINAQKLIGAEKIIIPGKHATEEDWAGVYRKLGLPEDVKEYKVAFKEGATIDPEFTGAFTQIAHKLGVLPKQAQGLAEWFSDLNMQAEDKYLNTVKEGQKVALEGLRTEWGKSYDANLGRAQNVLKNFGSPELNQHLEDTGFGNDPKLIKLLATIGDKMYKEGSIVSSEGAGIGGPMSPKDAKSASDTIMGNRNHPYHVKDHPGHKAAVKEVEALFQQMYPQ